MAKIKRRSLGQNTRQFILERDGNKCVKCNCKDELTLDHIVPLIKGGSNKRSNLQTLCEQCNTEKGSKDDAKFKKMVKGSKAEVKKKIVKGAKPWTFSDKLNSLLDSGWERKEGLFFSDKYFHKYFDTALKLNRLDYYEKKYNKTALASVEFTDLVLWISEKSNQDLIEKIIKGLPK